MQGNITPLDLFLLQQRIIRHKSRNQTDGGDDELCSSSYLDEDDEGILKVLTFKEVYEAYSEFLVQCNMIDRQDMMKNIRNNAECDEEGSSEKVLHIIICIVDFLFIKVTQTYY